MQKIIYFVSYFFSLMKFWGNKEIHSYYLVEENEFHANENLHFKEVVYKDKVVTEGRGVNGGTGKTHILRLPHFLVYDKQKNVTRDLKKHLLIGPKNFTEHENLKDKVCELESKIESLNNHIESLKEVNKDNQATLDYFKVQLTPKVYDDYLLKREGKKVNATIATKQ